MKQPYNFIAKTKSYFGFANLLLATLLSAQLCVTGQTAASLNFDGVDDKIDIAHNAAFNLTNGLSLEVWINTNVSGQQFITTKDEDSWYLAVNGDNNHSGKTSVFLNGVAPSGWLNGNISINDGNWHHIAATYDGVKLKLYVDGALDGEKLCSGAVSTGTSNIKIGMRPFFPFQSYFAGNIDEFRIWSVARTQCEIKAYMKCEITGTASGLVANYHFNQGSPAGNNSSVTTLTSSAGAFTGTLSNFALSGSISNWVASGGVLSGSNTPASIPTFSASSDRSVACAGESVTLTANGATSYTWSNGSNAASSVINASASTVYTVNAYNGFCDVTATVSLTVNNCTGVKTNQLSTLRVYPVPANEKLNLSFNQNQKVIVDIFSADGKKVKSLTAEGIEIAVDIAELNSGLYLLKLQSENENVSRTFLKQ